MIMRKLFIFFYIYYTRRNEFNIIEKRGSIDAEVENGERYEGYQKNTYHIAQIAIVLIPAIPKPIRESSSDAIVAALL